MSNDRPLVSVFMPAYNQQAFVGAAIDSVLAQDYEHLEIVVGDDCSTDRTWEIVLDYQRRFPGKIKAFRNERNLGITRNCNEVLKRCEGKYIVFHAGDDLYLPGKIRKQVDVMERDASIVLCYHDIEVFNSETNKTICHWNHGPLSMAPVIGTAYDVAKAMVEKGTAFMAALSVMVKADAVPASGYDVRVPVASDWLMWIEILANGNRESKVEYIPDVLARYRKHATNVTGPGHSHISDEFVTLAIVESRYPFLIQSVARGYAPIRYRFGVRMIANGNLQVGRRFLMLSLRSRWVSWKIFYWLLVSYFPFLLRLRTWLRR